MSERTLDKLEDARARIDELEQALRDILEADCCGCSVYGTIAQAALSRDEVFAERLVNWRAAGCPRGRIDEGFDDEFFDLEDWT